MPKPHRYTCHNLDHPNTLDEGDLANLHPKQRAFLLWAKLGERWRLQGGISKIIMYEQKAERCYNQLPKYLRW